MAKKPLGFAGGGINLYAYVLNDPVNMIDPLGLKNFHYYGNWGGPGYTGGLWTSWDLMSGWEQEWSKNNRAPIDEQDACYMRHDICYGKARVKCKKEKLNSCRNDCLVNELNKCDENLRRDLIKVGFTGNILKDAFRIGAQVAVGGVQPYNRKKQHDLQTKYPNPTTPSEGWDIINATNQLIKK